MSVIYTVTVMTADFKHKRCWGWFPTYEAAEQPVMANHGMFERFYDYAVIEEVPSGIGVRARREWWFDSHGLRRAMPLTFRNISNFGIG